MARSGARWRDLPERLAITALSTGTTIDWVERGVLQDLFNNLSHDDDFEWLCVDAKSFALIGMPVAHAGKKGRA
jgi:hypothetical protein